MSAVWQSASGPVSSAFGWWFNELAQLVPSGLRRMGEARGPETIVSVEAGGLRLESAERARQRGGSETSPIVERDELLQRLSARVRSGATGSIGLRVPAALCFSRRVDLPAAATRDAARILELDFERATPFRLKDVYTDYVVEDSRAPGGKVTVRQLVLKRSLIEPLITECQAAGLSVDRLDCWSDDRTRALDVNFLEDRGAAEAVARRKPRLPKVLALTAGCLALSAAYLYANRHESALLQLRTETAALKVKSDGVMQSKTRSQSAFASLASLERARAEYVSRVRILEELTRLLPDTAYLTSIKIDGGTIDIAGFAGSAASLLPLLEQSTLFVDAAMTAPVVFDGNENKDRFGLRVRLRPPVGQATAPPQAAAPEEAP